SKPECLLQPLQLNHYTITRIEIAENIRLLPAQKIRAHAHTPMIAEVLRNPWADQVFTPRLWIQAGQDKQLRSESVAEEICAKVNRSQMVVAWQQQFHLRRRSEGQEVLTAHP